MLYTCAYWKDGTRTLEEAQRNKIDHVAPKLLLKPGESVVDVGSGFGGFMFHAAGATTASRSPRSTPPAQQVEHAAARDRARAARQARCRCSRRLPRRGRAVRQGGVDRLPGARRPRPARASVIRAHARFPEAGRPRPAALHRPRRPLRHRVLHPQARVPRRLDPEPRRRDRRDGEGRPRGARHREPAPPLRADARRLGRALRPQLGRRSARSTRRASTSASAASGACYLYGCAEMFRSPTGRTHLFQIVFSKGNVAHELPDDAATSSTSARRSPPPATMRRIGAWLTRYADARRQARCARRSRCRRGAGGRSRSRKETSNLFRDRAARRSGGASTCARSIRSRASTRSRLRRSRRA